MKHFRKNKKGFSLVELIIVIAIMVALIVVMAPAFVKYVARSHNAVVTAAAESVLQFVKAELSEGALTGSGDIIVEGKVDSGGTKKTIHVYWSDDSTFQYDGGEEKFIAQCGADTGRAIKSDLKYTITVNDMTVEGHPQLVEVESTIADNG